MGACESPGKKNSGESYKGEQKAWKYDAGGYTGWGREKVRLGQAEGERKERKRSKYSREVFNGVLENDECYVYKRFGFNTTLH